MKKSNRMKKVCALFLAAALLVIQAPVNAFADTVDKISVTVYAYDYTALDAGIPGHSETGVILDGVSVQVDPADGVAGALEAAATVANVPCVKTASYYGGYYISSINGLSELADGYPSSGWMASIKGDYNNYSLSTSDDGAVIRFHYSIEGYGTDINNYWSGSPTITSFTLADQTIDVTKLTGNGSGTQADPYVITVPVATDTALDNLQASYQTTLNAHYVQFATGTGLTDISKTADYSSVVNCCLTGIDGTSKTYYKIQVTEQSTEQPTEQPTEQSTEQTAPQVTQPILVSGVTLSATTLSMIKGSTTTLTATVLPANAANTSLSYTSSNTSIAKVDGNGVITAKKAGTAVITVAATDGSMKTATCVVTVKNPTVKFNVTSMQIQKGKTTSALTVSGLQKGDSVQTYKSTNRKVVSVNAKGVLNAKKTGTATITVTTKFGAKATCKVTVQTSAVVTKSLKLGASKLSVKKGKTAAITVARNPVNATDKITYTSSNTKIASVSKTGVVTAKKKGSCKVTIRTASGVTQKVTIKVK